VRTAVIFAFSLTVSLLGVATMSHQLKQQRLQQKEQQEVRELQRRRKMLQQFIATLDPEIMKACVKQHDSGKPMNLDTLVTCGDFETYAEYLRATRPDAVRRFKRALLESSSRIEFEDRLAN
jgi:hypothetical protein